MIFTSLIVTVLVLSEASSQSVFPSPSSPGVGNPGVFVSQRCYSVNATISYNIPGGFTDDSVQLRGKYDNFLQAVNGQISQCGSVTLTLRDISTTPPEESNVVVTTEILFTADDSVSDDQVDTTVLLCITTVQGLQSSIQTFAPQLTGGDNAQHPANSVIILSPRSCCGNEPPPCDVLITTRVGLFSTPGSMTTSPVNPGQVFSVVKRCHVVDVEVLYNIPAGTNSLSENFIRVTFEPLLQNVPLLVSSCSMVSFNMEQITVSSPEGPNVRIGANIVATADSSVPDGNVATILSSCIETIRNSQILLVSVLPPLPGRDGTDHPANSITIGDEESCCDETPPPCTVLLSSGFGAVSSHQVSFSMASSAVTSSRILSVFYSMSSDVVTESKMFSESPSLMFDLQTTQSSSANSISRSEITSPSAGTTLPTNILVKRCYTVEVKLFYNIPGEVSTSEDDLRTELNPLLHSAPSLVSDCNDVIFNVENILFILSGKPNVEVVGTVTVTATDKIQDDQVSRTLSSCIQAVRSFTQVISAFAPQLTDNNGGQHSAQSLSISSVAPPCTMILHTLVPSLRTQDLSTVQQSSTVSTDINSGAEAVSAELPVVWKVLIPVVAGLLLLVLVVIAIYLRTKMAIRPLKTNLPSGLTNEYLNHIDNPVYISRSGS